MHSCVLTVLEILVKRKVLVMPDQRGTTCFVLTEVYTCLSPLAKVLRLAIYYRTYYIIKG